MMDLALRYWGTDWLGMIFAVFSIFLLTQKKRSGFTIGVVCNVFWITFGFLSGSLASILANIVYAGINVHGWFKWSREQQNRSFPKNRYPFKNISSENSEPRHLDVY